MVLDLGVPEGAEAEVAMSVIDRYTLFGLIVCDNQFIPSNNCNCLRLTFIPSL